jgi:hypothetical protein
MQDYLGREDPANWYLWIGLLLPAIVLSAMMSMMTMRVIVLTGAILGCAIPAAGQVNGVPPDTIIALERTSCFGACPVYSVRIDATGQVSYEGKENVRIQGRQTDRIQPAQVASILATVDRIGFFELRDRYSMSVTDLPTTFVTVTRQGRTKRVEDYLGAPAGLLELERQIDEATRTRRWTFYDAPMLQQLISEGWKPTTAETADVLKLALRADDIELIKALIDLGVDPNSPEGGTRTPPLYFARSANAARMLITAGAVVDLAVDDEGTTTLLRASCDGNVEVVRVLLEAGADPTGRGGAKSPIDCARERKESYSQSPFLSLLTSVDVQDYDRVIALLVQAGTRLPK